MTDTIRFESLLRRPPTGTVLDLHGASIHFRPDGTGREFADVPADLAHVLDAIPEGYVRVDADGTVLPPAAEAPTAQREAIAPATPADQPATPADQPVATGDDTVEGREIKTDEPELDAMGEGELRALFEKELGRPASPRAKVETLIAQIEQARAERAGN